MVDYEDNVVNMSVHGHAFVEPTLRVIGPVADTGSAPFLALASDNNKYWCKSPTSPHQVHAVVNEVAVGIIGRHMMAHVRPWAIIHVPDCLVGTRIRSKYDEYSLPTEVYGSQLLRHASLSYVEGNIPFIADDDNSRHVPKIIALWLVCNAQYDVQILIEKANDNSIWSIDHGFWFDSMEEPWQLAALQEPGGKLTIPRIHTPIPSDCWDEAIDSLDLLDDSLKDELWEVIPTSWPVMRSDCDALIDYALGRKSYARQELINLKQQTPRR
ncbi:hypothetical protein SAMN05660745_02523 [Corynebacterium glucuronolyticum]|nr:hypothetical protein CGLUCO_00365 [Corynebacterium glucuronolyticum DSM 44120]SMB81962.1 hypothetical protein SAMN05660745_02523 [Corynebacterium glucuronolyticum]